MNYNEYYGKLPFWAKKLFDKDETFIAFQEKFQYYGKYENVDFRSATYDWCQLNLGERNEDWEWLAGTWCFKNYRDLVKFKLEWVYDKEVHRWIRENNIDILSEDGLAAFKLRWM